MASRLRYSSPSSSDSGDSDDGGRPSLATAYLAIDVRWGLLRADTYAQAVAELEEILAIYKARDTPKDFRKAVEADIAVATASPLAAGPAQARALASLMAAAERVLPQSKRQALAREYKQRQLERARAARRRHTADSSDDGSDGEAEPLSIALPRECLDAIVAQLDPLSLVAAAATCRTWRDAAQADELWAPLLRATFGAAEADAVCREAGEGAPAAAGGDAPARRHFSRLAAAHPEWLLPWQSRRVAVHGAVRWVSPQTWGRVRAAPGPAGMAWNRALCVAFLTPGQVAVWLDRREPRYLAGLAAGWRQREAARRQRPGGGA